MKTFALLAVVLCSSAWGQVVFPPIPVPTIPSDAPTLVEVVPPVKLQVLADGSLAPGLSAHVLKGQAAPFEGRLLDPQEFTRREKINERNAGELASYKEPGNLTLTRAQFVLIVAGSAVAAAAAATAITFAAVQASKPKP